MAKTPHLSTKHLAIDKANTSVVIAVSIAAFLIVFCAMASKSLLTQRSYQAKVIAKKETALKQLDTNINEVERLLISYKEFSGATQNVLGGNPKGNADRDGENPRIILDALPSKYDFPAVATSLDKLITGNGFQVKTITGIDDEVNQSANQSSGSPQFIEMPFTFEAIIGNADAKKFMELFERSIRPIQVQKLSVVGKEGSLETTVTAKTYFQPTRNLNIKSEVVKQ